MTREEYKNKILDKEGMYYKRKYNEVRDSIRHTMNMLSKLGLLDNVSDEQMEEALEGYVIDLLTREYEVDTISDEQLEQVAKQMNSILGMFGTFM